MTTTPTTDNATRNQLILEELAQLRREVEELFGRFEGSVRDLGRRVTALEDQAGLR